MDERSGSTAPEPDLGSASALLAAIVEGSDDAIFAKDLDGVILSWNHGAERMYGYTAEEIVGRNVSVLVPPEVGNDVPAIMERLRRGERIQHYETMRGAKDGRRLDVALTISPIRDRWGTIVGASTIARDITAAKRAELRRSALAEVAGALSRTLDPEEVLQQLARTAVKDFADYCVVYLGEADEEIQRVALAHAEDAKGELVRKLLDAPAPGLDDEAGAGAVMRTGRPILATIVETADLERAAADPEYLAVLRKLGPISSIVVPIRTRGRTIGALALATTGRSGRHYLREDLDFAQDIADRAGLAVDNARLFGESRTEVRRRRRMEGTLRRRYEQVRILYRLSEAVSRARDVSEIHEEALRALAESVSATGVTIQEIDDGDTVRCVRWDGIPEAFVRRVCEFSPWPLDGRGRGFQAVVIPDVASSIELPRDLRRSILDEGHRAMAFVPVVLEGRLLAFFTLFFEEARGLAHYELDLVRTIAGTVAFATVRVMDARRVDEAREAAERASQAKSRFLAIMSHELRTPLNSVVGYADLLVLEAEGVLSERQRGYVGRVKSSAAHQLRLIEDILDYARLEAVGDAVRPAPADVVRSIEEALEQIRPEALQKGLRLVQEEVDQPVEVVTDAGRLRQILINLVANAVKFTDRGEVRVGVSRLEEGVAIEIRDTGPGIPSDELDRIWEPFAQADESFTREAGGTGLGLAIARRLADLIDGRLEVESEVGRGSRFTLILPQAPST